MFDGQVGFQAALVEAKVLAVPVPLGNRLRAKMLEASKEKVSGQ